MQLNQEQLKEIESNGFVYIKDKLVIPAQELEIFNDCELNDWCIECAAISFKADLSDDRCITFPNKAGNKYWFVRTDKVVFNNKKLYFTAGDGQGCFVDFNSPKTFWLRRNENSIDLIPEDAVKLETSKRF